VHGDALIVAGGANFPHQPPWEGGVKVWHDDVFVLEKPDGPWRKAGSLPVALGYGVAVSHARGLVCIGGSNADRHFGSVMVLRWLKGRLQTELLLGLPQDGANLSGALVGDTVYVAGGIERPDSTNALNTLWSMDLSQRRPGWRKLEPLPGAGRMLATAGAFAGSFYLFGGASLHAGPDGRPVRDWLREAWRYTPGKGWKQMADLPRVAVAAPSPAPVVNDQLLVIGGDDGAQVKTRPTDHKGFRRDVLAYDPKTDRWERWGEMPAALVTTPAVRWGGKIIIPGGEARPGIRSTEIWSLEAR
jgi:N-acetylneuraminic acid mutarotase